VDEGFVDIRQDLLNFFVLMTKMKTVCCLVLYLYFSDSMLVSIARNSGIYTKFTTCLQKDTENAAEPICCPVLKGRRQMLALVSILYGYLYSLCPVPKINPEGHPERKNTRA